MKYGQRDIYKLHMTPKFETGVSFSTDTVKEMRMDRRTDAVYITVVDALIDSDMRDYIFSRLGAIYFDIAGVAEVRRYNDDTDVRSHIKVQSAKLVKYGIYVDAEDVGKQYMIFKCNSEVSFEES